MQLFLDTSADQLQEMAEGLERDDHQSLELAAHTLKSSSANVGGRALSQACARLQDAASTGSADELESLVAKIQSHYQAVRTEATQILDAAKPESQLTSTLVEQGSRNGN